MAKTTSLEAVPGVGPGTAKKLVAAHITTAELLAVQRPDELKDRAGITEGTGKKIIKNAQNLVDKYTFRSGLEVEQEDLTKPILATGIEELDQRLMGGIELGSLVEFYGKASGGKTQWCYHLAVRAQMSIDDGGLECAVLWLDTEKAFKAKVVRANAVRWGLDPDNVLGNIRTVELVNTTHLRNLFEKVPQMCAEENVQLVVVDSLTGQFRQEYMGISNLATRQQNINSMLNLMRRAASATDATFLYTNQAITKPGMGTFQQPNAPIGGHIMGHGSDYRFMVGMADAGRRRIVLKDNAGLPDFEVRMSIGWGGFYNDAYELKREQPAVRDYLATNGYSTRVDEPVKVESMEPEEASGST
ncbi:MAG: helix-hairpin-helix domain-containing protein [Candidatus Thorarchaeota archaeon]